MIKKNIKTGIIIPYPAFEEKKYKDELLALVTHLKSLTLESILHNKVFRVSFNRSIRQDDVVDDLTLIIAYIKVKVESEVTKLVNSLNVRATKINLFNRNAFTNLIQESFKTSPVIELEPLNIEQELKLWAYENARLIKSIPQQMLNKVADSVVIAVRNRHSISTLAGSLHKAFDIGKHRAKIIARDQIAKLNGCLTRHRNLALGITQYKWLTCRDERVRASHIVLEGKICSWADSSTFKNNINDISWQQRSSIGGATFHPGLDIMCRCTSIAIL